MMGNIRTTSITNHSFSARIYVFQGKTFLCPDSSLKAGDVIISINPLKEVDPMKKYAFVYTIDGEHSVSRKRLTKVKLVTIQWKRTQLMTYNAEMSAKIEAMQSYLKEYLEKTKIEKI